MPPKEIVEVAMGFELEEYRPLYHDSWLIIEMVDYQQTSTQTSFTWTVTSCEMVGGNLKKNLLAEKVDTLATLVLLLDRKETRIVMRDRASGKLTFPYPVITPEVGVCFSQQVRQFPVDSNGNPVDTTSKFKVVSQMIA